MEDNQNTIEYEDKQDKASLNKPARDEKGRLLPGSTANPYGRPLITDEEKARKKATQELIEEYKEKLAEALPLISPVLIQKAQEGSVKAIKELHDRVMGKAIQSVDLTGNLIIKGNKIDLNSYGEDSETECE